jgi:acyl-coenzyme A thioesterase 13
LTKQQQATQAFLSTPLGPSLTNDILGNAPISVKELPVKWLAIFRSRGNGYCNSVAEKLKVTEVSIGASAEDPQKLEGMTACEVEVTPGAPTTRGPRVGHNVSLPALFFQTCAPLKELFTKG